MYEKMGEEASGKTSPKVKTQRKISKIVSRREEEGSKNRKKNILDDRHENIFTAQI
jgi:hypothetical protein